MGLQKGVFIMGILTLICVPLLYKNLKFLKILKVRTCGFEAAQVGAGIFYNFENRELN